MIIVDFSVVVVFIVREYVLVSLVMEWGKLCLINSGSKILFNVILLLMIVVLLNNK